MILELLGTAEHAPAIVHSYDVERRSKLGPTPRMLTIESCSGVKIPRLNSISTTPGAHCALVLPVLNYDQGDWTFA
jgi:hypothetical protein